ncbi:hypothetical protein Asphe3_30500 [Pseudarthrobacter phenanthrenivorans Sphe3]|uniref:Uncharacterized protein n=1 Tax=Pseudarthrobacter phenanthrenivorans (strain DSM 18606 / JCM 16027 / LMG 23796 / Sphe3) TaxID=930171 RepID=F0M1G4_PSEPM|nr:hypothetical protein [Pseudarthrobacter phenanthrenivorans]ADX74160.1 hypothetical protein Asphe3_30500 [Pseudarthrobacter phenanthrenivorans Sphe3]
MKPKARRYVAIILRILAWPLAVIIGLFVLFNAYGVAEQAYQQEGLYNSALLLSIWLSAALLFIALVLLGHVLLDDSEQNLRSRKSFKFAGGLAVGMAAALVLSLWLEDGYLGRQNDAVNGITNEFEAAVVQDHWEETYTHFVGESLYCWPISDTCLVATRRWETDIQFTPKTLQALVAEAGFDFPVEGLCLSRNPPDMSSEHAQCEASGIVGEYSVTISALNYDDKGPDKLAITVREADG